MTIILALPFLRRFLAGVLCVFCVLSSNTTLEAQGSQQYNVSFGTATVRVDRFTDDSALIRIDTVCTSGSVSEQPAVLYKLALQELLTTNALNLCDPEDPGDQYNPNYLPGEWPCNNVVIIKFPICFTLQSNGSSTCVVTCNDGCLCEIKLVYCYLTDPGAEGYHWSLKNRIYPPPIELYPRPIDCPPYGQDQCPGSCLEGGCWW